MSDESTYGSPAGGEKEGGTSPASDQEVLVQEGGQPKEPEPQGNEQTITPQYLKEMESRIIEEATKRAQSMTDKMGSRLDKEIQSALQTATQAIELGKQSGVKYTPEQEQAIRDRAINSAYERMNQPSQQSSPQDSAPQQQAQPKPQDQGNQPDPAWVAAGQRIQRIMSETGVYIPPDEANRLIIGENGENPVDPFEYVQAFESLARQRQLNNSQPRGPNPNIPSLATGGRATKAQAVLRQNFDKEMAQIKAGNHPSIRRGDIMAVQKLETSYRQQGLEI